MVALDFISDDIKEKIIRNWRTMSETDKAHFINQVALVLSVLGSDESGRRVVVEVLKQMSNNGTQTLADFGLYVEKAIGTKEATGLEDKIKRASLIIDGYRIKNGLPSEPHRELF